MELVATIEKVLKEKIRPALQSHGGDLQWEEIHPETGRIKIRLTGACSHCPGTMATLETLVAGTLREVWPDFKGVDLDTGVSQELLEQALAILAAKHT